MGKLITEQDFSTRRAIRDAAKPLQVDQPRVDEAVVDYATRVWPTAEAVVEAQKIQKRQATDDLMSIIANARTNARNHLTSDEVIAALHRAILAETYIKNGGTE